MTGKFLFPLWKRGIKGDLLEWRGDFLGRRAADFFEALNQDERKKSPLAPLFQRGEQLVCFALPTTSTGCNRNFLISENSLSVDSNR